MTLLQIPKKDQIDLMDRVLKGIHEHRGYSVPEALNGFHQFPPRNSDDYILYKCIEDDLIKLRLCYSDTHDPETMLMGFKQLLLTEPIGLKFVSEGGSVEKAYKQHNRAHRKPWHERKKVVYDILKILLSAMVGFLVGHYSRKCGWLIFVLGISSYAFGQQLSHGTAISYAIVNNTEVFIAADAKELRGDTIDLSTCKINYEQGYVWAAAGVIGDQVYYDINNIVRESISVAPDFDIVKSLISVNAGGKLNYLIPSILEINRKYGTSNSQSFLNVFFCTFKYGSLKYAELGFYLNDSVNPTGVNPQPFLTPSGGIVIRNIGTSDSADAVLDLIFKAEDVSVISANNKFLVPNKPDIDLRLIDNMLYYLVYVETKKSPKIVGGKITTARFTKDGLFVFDKGRCFP